MPPWGEAVDPRKDCEITGDKDRVRIKLFGARQGPQTILNTPRVMQEVEGDFVLTVKVVGEFRPGEKSTNPRSVSFNGAGVLVWSDPNHYIRLERAAVNRRGAISTYVNFEQFEGGPSASAAHNAGMKEGDCWVRMERKGNLIHGSISFDRAAWIQLKPMQTAWPTKVMVGVSATSSSNLPFSVVFEEFELKGEAK
jgi:regulation of enolase protein 1 (concanavalin A-like superfamily)